MFTLDEIISATVGKSVGKKSRTEINGVSTDSRNINPGDLFVPLKGKKFDGHIFIDQAFKMGASSALISNEYISTINKELLGGRIVIQVEDTLMALQGLAAMHRRRFNIPVIAVTGSNGKTTTKEMAYSILNNSLKTLRNEGNLNNYIGVPLTIFKLSPDHQAFIAEMGISIKGELSELCKIALPTKGVITNIGPTHLETLGSIEGVAEAKYELARFTEATGGCLILNGDDPYLARLIPDIKADLLTYGMEKEAKIRGVRSDLKEGYGESLIIRRYDGETDIQLRLFGRHNIYNALAAAAIATSLGFRLDEIKRGLEGFVPVPLRSETVRLRKGTMIINDSYNANPASMRCAISTLGEVKGRGMAIAVLGDMLELGASSMDAHLEIGRFTATCGIDRLILYGDMAAQIQKGAKDAGMDQKSIRICGNKDDIPQLLLEMAGKDDAILVKGSRGMGLDSVVKKLLTCEAA
ncbi:MAG: UDP-N-acetylmuramoyl-tripeptide--D-alanyl-D-alanine ligase [Nitrospirota bacterium]